MERKRNGWKITAIIFIILFVVENLFFLWVIRIQNEAIKKESECVYNVCNYDEAIYFKYFAIEEVCECYDADMNLIKRELING